MDVVMLIASLVLTFASPPPRHPSQLRTRKAPAAQVAAIDALEKRIATAEGRTRRGRRVTVQGSPAGAEPSYVSVKIAEGSAVIDETYVFERGHLRLAVIKLSWDGEHADDAPGPPRMWRYYITDDKAVQSVPPAQFSAATLISRAHKIALLLDGEGPLSDAALDEGALSSEP